MDKARKGGVANQMASKRSRNVEVYYVKMNRLLRKRFLFLFRRC